MPNQTYSYSQLRKLWIKSGGSRGWSYVMAAVAMAESHGNPSAHNVDSDGSVDWGLWQINSVHFRGNINATTMQNPEANAKEAVAVFNSSGPAAWSTYKNGAYKQYMPSNKSAPNISNPVPGGKFGRIDQGVDYVAEQPVRALVAGRITDIVPFATGEGVASHTAILEKFDAPVSYGGRTYYGGYYAEEQPLVKKGQHVKAGQNVMAKGSDEIGYLVAGGTQFPKLRGTIGAGTLPSPEGEDFAGTVAKLGGPKPPGGNSWLTTALTVAGDAANPIGSVLGDAASGLADNPLNPSNWVSGIEAKIEQGFFILIGGLLLITGLALVVWTVMGKIGAPGAVGMVQSQMRIKQAGARIDESQRASMVRESQAGARLTGRDRDRELAARRVTIQERNSERRTERYVVKDKPNQVVRKKAGNPAAGVPRKAKG